MYSLNYKLNIQVNNINNSQELHEIIHAVYEVLGPRIQLNLEILKVKREHRSINLQVIYRNTSTHKDISKSHDKVLEISHKHQNHENNTHILSRKAQGISEDREEGI